MTKKNNNSIGKKSRETTNQITDLGVLKITFLQNYVLLALNEKLLESFEKKFCIS